VAAEKTKDLLSRMESHYRSAVHVSIEEMKEVLVRTYKSPSARKWAQWMIGESGIGKNFLIDQAAEELDVKVLWFPCKGLAAEDLRGIPKLIRKLDQSTEYENSMEGMVSMMKDYYSSDSQYVFQLLGNLLPAFQEGTKMIIHLDEWAQASKEVQAMLYMLLYDRKIDDHKLSDGVMIVCSMNPPSQSEYMLNKIQKAAQDRPVLWKVEANVSDWIKWAERNEIDDRVTGFVREHPVVFEKNKGRRLHNLSDMLTIYTDDDITVDTVADESGEKKTVVEIPHTMKAAIQGCIDLDSAGSFMKYLKSIYEISGIQILMGDKKSFDRLKKTAGSRDKAVFFYRIQQEILAAFADPEQLLPDLFKKHKNNKEKTHKAIAKNLLDYLNIIKENDLDTVMAMFKGICDAESYELENVVDDTLTNEEKYSELFKEVDRCMGNDSIDSATMAS